MSVRIGYVMAHELAHETVITGWTAAAGSLLSEYASHLHVEAMADVVATVALVESGLATVQEVCDHVSQLWCARMPPLYEHPVTASHPAPNERGDALCTTLKRILM